LQYLKILKSPISPRKSVTYALSTVDVYKSNVHRALLWIYVQKSPIYPPKKHYVSQQKSVTYSLSTVDTDKSNIYIRKRVSLTDMQGFFADMYGSVEDI